jgi:hypothetical protein
MDLENGVPQLLQEAVQSFPIELLVGFLVALAVAAVAAYVVWKALRPQKPQTEPPDLEYAVDLAALGEFGPPAGFPVLEFYHVPMRLAAVVLAPAGAGRELPPADRLGELIDSVVPGLAAVVAAHRPPIRLWPSQVSISGFAHKFFRKTPLPGDGGKGTPWCSVAGVFEYKDQPYLIGLILRAETNNSHSQYAIEQPTKWLDLLRVKQG